METKLKNSPEWRLGREGEEIARRWFQELGHYVLPSMLIENGGAPLLESKAKQLILPDLIASKAGKSILIDIKTKSKPTFNRWRNRMVSGIEIRHFESYIAVGRAMGMQVAILFIFADRGEMHLGFIDEIVLDSYRLDDPKWFESHPDHAFKEPMIFFNVDPNHGTKFTMVVTKEDVARSLKAKMIAPRSIKPWDSFRHYNGQGLLNGF